jgi:hypothetical protein
MPGEANYVPLIDALREAREFLARPDNDFAWSSWENGAAALSEIDNLIARIEQGHLPKRLDLDVLFTATGPIQEVSVSSGWGDDFLQVARRYDMAADIAYGQRRQGIFRRLFGE